MTRYVYGLDPASKNDSFGIVVHSLASDTTKPPKLKAINKLGNTSFDKMYEYLVKDMFQRYPPYYIVIDYTNEKTFSDLLVRLYEKKVELVTFSNASKLMLKEDGLSVMKQGYKFPNPTKLQDPIVSRYVSELVEQLQHEQVLETKSGKTTFDHPSGQHNDLAIAWELSIHGCLRFIRKSSGSPVIVGHSVDNGYWSSLMTNEERLKKLVGPRIQNLGMGVKITGIKEIQW